VAIAHLGNMVPLPPKYVRVFARTFVSPAFEQEASVIQALYSLGCHQVYTRNCPSLYPELPFALAPVATPPNSVINKIPSCARWRVAATLKRRWLSRYSVVSAFVVVRW